MKVTLFGILLTSAMTLTGCSSLFQGHCNRSSAISMGEEDANNWAGTMPQISRGSNCEKKYTAGQFRTDYMVGFNNRLSLNCTESNARILGNTEGEAENLSKPTLPKLQLCAKAGVRVAKLRKAYNKGYEGAYCSVDKAISKAKAQAEAGDSFDPSFIGKVCKGSVARKMNSSYKQTYVGVFCSEEKATIQGKEDAESFRSQNLSFIGGVCTGSLARAMRNAYKYSYLSSLENQCGFARLTEKGTYDANNNVDSFVTLKQLEICPGDKFQVAQTYKSAYDKRKMEMQLQAERQRREQEMAELKNQIKKQTEELKKQSLNTSSVNFYVGKKPHHSTCQVVRGSRVEVSVYNEDRWSSSLSGKWVIKFYNQYGRYISKEERREHLTVFGKDKGDFEFSWFPREATTCKAFYRGKNSFYARR